MEEEYRDQEFTEEYKAPGTPGEEGGAGSVPSSDADYVSDYDERELPSQDEILRTRIEERKRVRRKQVLRRKRRTLILLILAVALMLTFCGRQILRLKAENHELKKEQAELTEQRDDLKDELKHANNKEYIKDKARRQLRLLNPGEILFFFGEEEKKEDAED